MNRLSGARIQTSSLTMKIYMMMKKAVKPLLFAVVSTLLAILVILGTLIAATIHVLFNGLLLYRAYKGFIYMIAHHHRQLRPMEHLRSSVG